MNKMNKQQRLQQSNNKKQDLDDRAALRVEKEELIIMKQAYLPSENSTTCTCK